MYTQAGCRTIIIEPTRLGEETSRWISMGNFLRKTSLISGCGAFILGMFYVVEGVKGLVVLSRKEP